MKVEWRVVWGGGVCRCCEHPLNVWSSCSFQAQRAQGPHHSMQTHEALQHSDFKVRRKG